jgi:hypothetical protein
MADLRSVPARPQVPQLPGALAALCIPGLRAFLPASAAVLCQFLVILPGQCAQILLP